jgi:CRISPR/Cas system-associated exonuclease Cas4 (RecB family)
VIVDDFNKTEEAFEGIYTYPRELYTKDLSAGMKKILEENGIHPIPLNSYVKCNNV